VAESWVSVAVWSTARVVFYSNKYLDAIRGSEVALWVPKGANCREQVRFLKRASEQLNVENENENENEDEFAGRMTCVARIHYMARQTRSLARQTERHFRKFHGEGSL